MIQSLSDAASASANSRSSQFEKLTQIKPQVEERSENQPIQLISDNLKKDFQLSRLADYNPKVTLKPNFYVPPHPLVLLTVPYGLFLVFAAWLAPSLLSELIPLGALARYLGFNFNGLMALLSIFAGTLHIVVEPLWALYLAGRYQLNPKTSLLWAGNAFVYGIFGLWPLVFPEYFEEIEDQYCAFSPCPVTFSSKKYQNY